MEKFKILLILTRLVSSVVSFVFPDGFVYIQKEKQTFQTKVTGGKIKHQGP